jgi:colicin import membrane protein
MTADTPSALAPRRPRVAHHTVPSFGLALAMHVLLFIGMSVAVRWKTEGEAAAVAEVWGPLPPVMEVAPPPPPPVEVKPEPKPEPPPPKEPDIVEKQEKKAPPKKEEKKPDIDKKKLEEQRRLKELEQQREVIRKEEAARLERQLGPTTASTPVAGRGTDAGWNAQVIACIRPHIAYAVPEYTSSDVHAEFRLEVLPTGEQVAVRLTRPSNLPGFDAAAERAIRRCDPIPRQKDGTVPRTFVLVVRPVEMR